jgi:hypothetical protein
MASTSWIESLCGRLARLAVDGAALQELHGGVDRLGHAPRYLGLHLGAHRLALLAGLGPSWRMIRARVFWSQRMSRIERP